MTIEGVPMNTPGHLSGNLPGKRVKLTKWVHGRSCAVRVQVEGVVPDDAPGEACLEPRTVKLLDELQRLADADNADALARHGEVFVRRSA